MNADKEVLPIVGTSIAKKRNCSLHLGNFSCPAVHEIMRPHDISRGIWYIVCIFKEIPQLKIITDIYS